MAQKPVTHQLKGFKMIEEFNISICKECGLKLIVKVNTIYGKRWELTHPEVPGYSADEICDGDCA